MANGPGGKSVGRVSIRVVPDTTRFKADLKKSLDRIEKSTVLKLQTAADTRQAELDIRKFVKKASDQQVSLNARVKTLGAAADLKLFARKRLINLDVNITKTSLAKASAMLAALSGGRLAGDLVNGITEQLGGLDRALPKIAALVLAIGSIGAVALSSVGGLFTLAASLSTLLALAAPAPGLLGAMLSGVVVLGIALSDASTQLSSLGPVWTRLKSIITDNFWAKAKKPIIDFVQSTVPQLKAGLGPVASALGSWAASIAAGFQKAFGGGALAGMLQKLRESIDIASTGTSGFASTIVTLGTFGAQYLPRIAGWFADITNQFDGWLSKVAADGSLVGWVNNALIVAKQLGSVLGSVFGIIGGLAAAASAAGGGGLATFAAVMATIADTINSPAFQTTLTTLFQGAAAGVTGLATALAPIGQMLAVLAPTLSTLLSSIGVTLGTVVGQIASALSSPAFSAGILALFQGLRDGIVAIQPALPAVAAALGNVAQFAGVLAAQLGPILGAALAALAPIVSQVLAALQPLLPILGSALLSVIAALAPVLQQLIPALAPLVQIIGKQLAAAVVAVLPLLGAIMPIVSALIPIVSILVQAFAPLVQGILPILMGLISAVTPIIQSLAGIFAQVAAAVVPIITAILPPLNALFQALMPIIMAVVNVVMALLEPILGLIAPLLQLIGPILAPLIQLLTAVVGIVGVLTPVINALAPVFRGVASAIGGVLLPVVQMIMQVLQGLITFITGVFTGNWKQAWNGIVQIFSGIWNGIIGIGKGVINGVVDIINGLIGGVNSITSKVGIPAIPKIPHLALGADVEASAGGTLVVLGEGGQKETVTNYGRTNAMIDAANKLAERALGTGGGGGGNTFNITEVSDPVGTSMAVARRLEALGA